ncbi:MAG TPA: hypothetical protein VF178_00285 [Gemmatimonadaceae bacterium]
MPRSAGANGSRPSLIELVGPAGAGKSTLMLALTEHDTRLTRGPSVWSRPRLDLARSTLAVAPVVAGALRHGQFPHPRELAQMLRLDALRREVDRLAHDGRVRLVDEGPVFALSWLDVFYGRGDPWFRRWRERAVRDWSARLLAVIRLDADDVVLVRRIRTRAQPHPVKHTSDGEIFGFTARYRRAFDRVIGDLRAMAPVAVVNLRTDEYRAAQAAARAQGVLEEALHGH